MSSNLHRFHTAQEKSYDDALQEMKNGKKTSHWMWYIFPQIKGLGKSDTARKYEIENLDEAVQYLQDQVLSERIIHLTEILVGEVSSKSAQEIFGFPDYLKFRSSLTLFDFAVSRNKEIFANEKFSIFAEALNKYYAGKRDERTLEILRNS